MQRFLHVSKNNDRIKEDDKMKGAELTTSTIILIILGIIVLVCFILFILNSKGTVDVISAREALRNCCGDRSVYDCKGGAGIPLSSINCKVPGSSNTVTLDVLMAQVGIIDTQLNSFCFCPP
jgi:hypothetical protein